MTVTVIESPPGMAEPAAAEGASQAGVNGGRGVLRTVFKHANKFVMVPALKLGLARTMCNPAAGYMMLLTTTGSKSGLKRLTPLNYAISDGGVYCLAGFGEKTHWLHNIQADPHVEVMLPGGAVMGVAEVITGTEEAARMGVAVARNSGFALLFEGVNPLTVTNEQLAERLQDRPVVRIRPVGLANGPQDPGGWGWVMPTLAQVAGILWLIRRWRGRRPPPLS